MKTIFLPLLSLLIICSSVFSSRADVNAVNGEKIFKQYCTSCHKPAPFDTKLVGPPLKDIQKVQTEEWLMKWIRNNAALRASGDKAAIDIWTQYGKNEMPTFTSFSDDDIKSILAYIAAPPAAPSAQQPASGPAGATSTQSSTWLYIVLVALLLIVIMLMRANKALKHIALEKEGQPIPEEVSWRKRLFSKKAWLLYGLIIVFLTGWTITDSAIRLGHSKDYSPQQPIKFPHDLHAGTLQINCLYCHAGAEKSKTAGIPPVSTCMNCHKAIQAGETPEGTAEIQKIYSAYENNKPIQWIKIHNLPDHVFFSHAQHVAVGKIQCQTCHGPVQDMKQVYQYASLSMGWCVNCHRQTQVQFQDNNYYTMFTDLHARAEKDTSFHVTEAMAGGTECQKCHY
ncbi:MAG: c-type cytochrome [Chitinophagales bacterium]